MHDLGAMANTEDKSVRKAPTESLRNLEHAVMSQGIEQKGATLSFTRDYGAPTNAPEPFEAIGLNRKRLLVGASMTAAIGSSLCCIVPIVAAVTGIGTIAAGAIFEPWRPYLLGITGLFLAAGFLLAYRQYQRVCIPGSLCATKPMSRWGFSSLLAIATAIVALAAFPYYSGAVAQLVLGQPTPSYSAGSVALSMATFQIPDMDCPACAVSLSATLYKLPGVVEAKLDVDSGEAVVSYDPATQNVAVLEKTIIGAGFHITSGPRF
jgi:mercuric ion transport protein